MIAPQVTAGQMCVQDAGDGGFRRVRVVDTFTAADGSGWAVVEDGGGETCCAPVEGLFPDLAGEGAGLGEARAIARAAAVEQVRRAGALIAGTVRCCFPQARIVHLAMSQGLPVGMRVIGWSDGHPDAELHMFPVMFGVQLDQIAEDLVLHGCGQALGAQGWLRPSVQPWGQDDYLLDVDVALAGSGVLPAVQMLVVRDPDGPTEVAAVTVHGVPVTSRWTHMIDAGAGWTWDDWVGSRDRNLERACPQIRPALLDAYDDPPGGQYVQDRDDRPWLAGRPGTEHPTQTAMTAQDGAAGNV